MNLTWRKVGKCPKWAGYERQDGQKFLVHVATVLHHEGEWRIWVGEPFHRVSHPDIANLKSAKDAKALTVEALQQFRAKVQP